MRGTTKSGVGADRDLPQGSPSPVSVTPGEKGMPCGPEDGKRDQALSGFVPTQGPVKQGGHKGFKGEAPS
jgi:hypothetical protein